MSFMTGTDRVAVKLEALAHFTDLRVESQQLDAGVFCVGDTQTIRFSVFNMGTNSAEIYVEHQ